MPARVRVFQIHYDAATQAAVDPDFEPLDNSASARPDWYEFWPIREFLRGAALDEQALYGFFSPRFAAKTGLRGAQVLAFSAAEPADVVTFSPHPCHSACFVNVFEQGEFFYPGIHDAGAAFLREAVPAFSLDTFVTDSRNTVFSNYFLARPAFWRRWSALAERLYAVASSSSPLAALLAREHDYGKEGGGPSMAVQVKVFVLERLASVLLEGGQFAVRNYPPFDLPLSDRFAGRLAELVALDGLKRAFRDSGDPKHLYAYADLRARVLREAYGGAAPRTAA
jgi:hypothetical protein